MKRREFLGIAAGGAAAATRWVAAETPGPATYTYKVVGECEVKADVYQAAGGSRGPAVVWIHGGALILGSRKSVDGRVLGELLKRGMQSVGKRVLSEPPAEDQRVRFYVYCRQNGIWSKEVTGHDPRAEPKWFDAYCPIRNVTAKYPPTLLIHGTDDTDVPYSESKNMAARLAECGVQHELITVPSAGHGLAGAQPDRVAQIAQRAAEFIQAAMG